MLGKVVKNTSGVRRPGAAALDLCYVACGRLDAFWETGLQPWDLAAGTLIIREAGGIVSALDGAKTTWKPATFWPVHRESTAASRNSARARSKATIRRVAARA